MLICEEVWFLFLAAHQKVSRLQESLFDNSVGEGTRERAAPTESEHGWCGMELTSEHGENDNSVIHIIFHVLSYNANGSSAYRRNFKYQGHKFLWWIFNWNIKDRYTYSYLSFLSIFILYIKKKKTKRKERRFLIVHQSILVLCVRFQGFPGITIKKWSNILPLSGEPLASGLLWCRDYQKS